MAIKARGTVGKSPPTSKRWHAVSVRPCSGACPASTTNRHRRWLSREAPQLPLPGCTKPDACHCTYQHHDDRRSGDGRRVEETDVFRALAKPAVERRNRPDRRSKPDE